MPPVTGPTITGPTAGQVLIEQTFPWPRVIGFIVLLSATYNFDALVEIWNGQGQVEWDLALPVAAPLWVSPRLGPRSIQANGRLRVLSRNTPVVPGPLEVQATLLWNDWAERG